MSFARCSDHRRSARNNASGTGVFCTSGVVKTVCPVCIHSTRNGVVMSGQNFLHCSCKGPKRSSGNDHGAVPGTGPLTDCVLSGVGCSNSIIDKG